MSYFLFLKFAFPHFSLWTNALAYFESAWLAKSKSFKTWHLEIVVHERHDVGDDAAIDVGQLRLALLLALQAKHVVVWSLIYVFGEPEQGKLSQGKSEVRGGQARPDVARGARPSQVRRGNVVSYQWMGLHKYKLSTMFARGYITHFCVWVKIC